MPADETIAIYDARAADYARMTEELGERAELEAFAAGLPRAAHVLDLGCGPGFYAAWLAAKGFTVEAWDGSAEMVALAGAHPGVKSVHARFDRLDGPARFDGIWANFSLLHLPHAALPAQLARIRRALKPGGLFHIGMKQGEGEGPDRIGRFYAYYSQTELTGLLEAEGFTILSATTGAGTGLDGSPSRHIILLARG